MLKAFLSLLLLFSLINVNGQIKDEPISLKNISIQINTGKFTATTQIDMEFFNPNLKVLDGQFDFSLQAEQVITGFALDINGFMREGVIVDKQKARVAYENTIRRRIDPGLVEKVADNKYRLRIYPMPADGSRKVRLTISQVLKVDNNLLHYSLPFDSVKVGQVEINIKSPRFQSTPNSEDGLLKGGLFILENDSYTFKMEQKNLVLDKPLAFSIPISTDGICFTRNADGGNFIVRKRPGLSAAIAPDLNTLTIYWDASGSAAKRNIKKELEFLNEFCKRRKVNSLRVMVFDIDVRDLKQYTIKSGLSKQVVNYLEGLVYDGGTRLDCLDKYEFNGDAALLFSDGVKNIGTDDIATDGKPLYCVNSSASANHQLLQELSRKNAGRYYDLSRISVEEAVSLSNGIQNKLVKIKSGKEIISVTNEYPVSFDQWLIVSGERIGNDEQIELYYGDQGAIVKVDTVVLNQDNICDVTEMKLVLTLHKLQRLMDDRNESALMDLSKKEKLVSAFTSFIVLDNVSDYIEHGIEPPGDLLEEYNKQLWVVRQNEERKKLEEENSIINNLQSSVDLYNERINWWGKYEKEISLILKPVEKKELAGEPKEDNTEIGKPVAQSTKFNNTQNLQEVVVVGYGSQRRMALSGAATVVNGSSISGSLNSMLSGRVAGVSIQANQPALGSNIAIRGSNSIRGGNEPLIVVDGVFVTNDQLAALHPNTIASVSVYKNNEASAIYGSRASNGAIVVVTRNAGNDNTHRYRNTDQGVQKYQEMADMDYVAEIKGVPAFEKYQHYLQLKQQYIGDHAFFIDMSQVMMEAGQKELAKRILSNLMEFDNENHQLLRAVGYTLENWHHYDEAVIVYKRVLEIKEEEPQSYRDLALAYERSGRHQESVNLLYKALIKNWYQYEDRFSGLKSLLLNEMNAIIARHPGEIDLSEIKPEIIRPLPVDLRIVIDWNKDETDIDLHIKEPDGEICYYRQQNTKSGGRLSDDFTEGYGPEEYQIVNMKKGKYSIIVDYFDDSYQKVQTPAVLKLTIYRNFGRPDQTVSIQTMVMNNQKGEIEIATVR